MVKRMRILLYSANFAPEPTGIGKYSGEMAQWLVEHGHTVRVVAAPPYYPSWKVDPAYAWPPYRREIWNGVEVSRAPLWVPAAPGGLSRILHLLSFAISSFPVMLRQVFWRPDLVITVAPAFLCAPTGLIIARLTGAQSWLHLQDFEVDLAFRMGLLKGNVLRRMVLRMERGLLRRFDCVSSISQPHGRATVEEGSAPGAHALLSQLVWTSLTSSRPRSLPRIARSLASPRTPRWSCSPVPWGASKVSWSSPRWRSCWPRARTSCSSFAAMGVMKPRLEAAAEGLTNMRFLPLQPFERLGELLCTADIHLLPQAPDVADLVLPSKLSGMLASARRPSSPPASPAPNWRTVVSKCGLIIAPDDEDAFAAAVCKLADNTTLRTELGRRARHYAETNFERDAILGRLFGPDGGDEARVTNDAIA